MERVARAPEDANAVAADFCGRWRLWGGSHDMSLKARSIDPAQ